MYFADFYQRDLNNNLVSACGDRSVLILDGRETLLTQIKHARQWAAKHGYTAFTLNKGESFTRCRMITKLQTLID